MTTQVMPGPTVRPAATAASRTRLAAVRALLGRVPLSLHQVLFRLAIAFEERASAYFHERMAKAPAGSPERALYQELAAEEREHVTLLSTEHERWKRGVT